MAAADALPPAPPPPPHFLTFGRPLGARARARDSTSDSGPAPRTPKQPLRSAFGCETDRTHVLHSHGQVWHNLASPGDCLCDACQHDVRPRLLFSAFNTPPLTRRQHARRPNSRLLWSKVPAVRCDAWSKNVGDDGASHPKT